LARLVIAIGHFHLPPTAQDDSIQLLALLLPFCFGVHCYAPPPNHCAHTRHHHLACLVPGALVATSSSPALTGIGDGTQYANQSTMKEFKLATILSSLEIHQQKDLLLRHRPLPSAVMRSSHAFNMDLSALS
jgi:hypothetical protein